MPRMDKVSRNNTKILKDSRGGIVVMLYRTPVVTVTEQNIILNTGGHWTATTKTRMNQASHEFKLGYYVFCRCGRWFVGVKGKEGLWSTGDILEFKEREIVLPRREA